MKKAVLLTVCLVLLASAAMADTSWSQINTPVSKPDGWTRIVENSPWQLGELYAYAGQEGIFIQEFGSYPSIDGSTVSVPMGMELARQLLSLPEEDLNGFVSFSTTPFAYERLIYGAANSDAMLVSENAVMDPSHPVDLILVTEPSDEERAMAAEEGVELEIVPFCCDAFVFLVNAQNSVDSLTEKQIRGIYSGSVYSWDEVGGPEPSPIIAYQRPRNSGSQTAMENMVMKGVLLAAAEPNYVTDGMADLVQQVGSYSNSTNALGYSYLYYVTSLYRDSGVKVLAVNGVSPTEENIRTGEYPYSVHYYAVYRKGDEKTAAFVDWLTGDEGQRCVAQAGYIPLR